ncbi:MAG: FHA domain-containing protein, partial [Pirellulales bacterium]|nr:FHA domain-containing protein [Pirellulales bacterium]
MISQSDQTETLTLTAVNSVGSTFHYTLQPGQGVFVGKSSNCGLQLGGDGLSDIHCRIELDDGKVWVQDWMSSEGTRVNGECISTKVEVHSNDVIEIGQHQLSFHREIQQESSEATESLQSPESLGTSPSLPEDLPEERLEHESPQPEAEADFTAESKAGAEAEAELEPDFDATAPAADFQCESDFESHVGPESHANPESHVELESHAGLESEPEFEAAGPVVSPPAEPIPPSVDQPDSFVEDPESMDFDANFFDFAEEETYDRETVALLQAEIEALQSALAQ